LISTSTVTIIYDQILISLNPLTVRSQVELRRVITSEEALQRYTGYILATPEIGLGLSNNPDLYHRSASGIEHSCTTFPSQGHYKYIYTRDLETRQRISPFLQCIANYLVSLGLP